MDARPPLGSPWPRTRGHFDALGSAIVRTATASTRKPQRRSLRDRHALLCGGTLQTRNIVRNGGNGAEPLFQWRHAGPERQRTDLQNMSAAYVSTNGAALDTSLTDFTLLQNLLHDPVLGGTATADSPSPAQTPSR
jgi:hypothetical protein